MQSWNRHPGDRELRTFALGLVPFLLVLGTLRWGRGGGTGLLIWGTACALPVCLLGLIRPQTLRWLYVGWTAAVLPIGWVVSHLIMGIVFFGLVTPIGWLLRITGTRSLPLRGDGRASYWEAVPADDDRPETAFRQF